MPDTQKERLNIENKINDAIKPRPDFSFTVNENTKVINLFVKQGEHTTYRYKGTAYKRNDTSSLPVNNFELNDLVLKGTHQHFDELPANVNGKLTFSKIEKALQNQLGIKKLSPDVQIMKL